MSLLGNCIIFVDTGFFTKFRPNDKRYDEIWRHANSEGLKLCTSWLCLEEWKSQKIKHIEGFLKDIRSKHSYHCGENFFSQKLISEPLYEEFDNEAYLHDKVDYLIQDFLKLNKIKVYPPNEEHISSTWNGYFHGKPPFKIRKNKGDIPDAWIFEGARSAFEATEHAAYELKYCISSDEYMSQSLEGLGYTSIQLKELIEILHKEEFGIVESVGKIESQVLKENLSVNDGIEKTPLDRLLTKAIYTQDSEIYLRLLGYLTALDTPTHKLLIDTVSLRGYNPKRVEACAVMLSGEPEPYMKDLGTHYIVGEKDICHAAAERVMTEIIEMLDRE